MPLATDTFIPVCHVDDILPDTGVCALVEDRHIAVFRVGADQFFALDNIDPASGASVLSRGLVGNLGGQLVVASPLYKHHFDLRTGACLEQPAWRLRTYAVHAEGGTVALAWD